MNLFKWLFSKPAHSFSECFRFGLQVPYGIGFEVSIEHEKDEVFHLSVSNSAKQTIDRIICRDELEKLKCRVLAIRQEIANADFNLSYDPITFFVELRSSEGRGNIKWSRMLSPENMNAALVKELGDLFNSLGAQELLAAAREAHLKGKEPLKQSPEGTSASEPVGGT